MPEVEQSDLMKNILTILINISGRKTTKGHAIITMDSLLKNLKLRYEFLRHVQIKDTRYAEDEDPVSVLSGLDDVDPTIMGKAIYDIITTMNHTLGRDAGHFFMKEIQSSLGDDYNSTMKEIGVDLSLMQLEREVEEWERVTTQKRE
jgi:hypothetical protein